LILSALVLFPFLLFQFLLFPSSWFSFALHFYILVQFPASSYPFWMERVLLLMSGVHCWLSLKFGLITFHWTRLLLFRTCPFVFDFHGLISKYQTSNLVTVPVLFTFLDYRPSCHFTLLNMSAIKKKFKSKFRAYM
jgi:hypothetical protein